MIIFKSKYKNKRNVEATNRRVRIFQPRLEVTTSWLLNATSRTASWFLNGYGGVVAPCENSAFSSKTGKRRTIKVIKPRSDFRAAADECVSAENYVPTWLRVGSSHRCVSDRGYVTP